MNDFDYIISEFMREYGFTALHVKRSGEYDTEQGKIVEVVKTTPVKAIILDLTLQSNGLSVKPGTEIQAGDKQLYVQPPEKVGEGIPPIVIEPTKDTIRVKDIEYKILSMKEHSIIGNTAIVYELYIRR